MTDKPVVYTTLESFVGTILIAQDDNGLKSIWFMQGAKARKPDAHWRYEKGLHSDAVKQLRAYFDGELQEFNLALSLEGTAFEKAVWKVLQQIPYGQTASYGEIAKRIDRPAAVRAVGGANGKNHIPIVIPCHRVIGSNGKLVGFGSGLPIKVALLEHERGHLRNPGPKRWRY